MSLIVQKYGGSSVADENRIGRVADRILERRRSGHDLVVVVSAMGTTTRRLREQAGRVADPPASRELDVLLATGECQSMALLAMALADRGAPSVSLTGAQAGIRTSDRHFNASIAGVAPERIRAELDGGRIAVVAGYQGLAASGDVATLGIGGSDISAVALAAALDADRCEICSDVPGVFSADPRLVDGARRLDEISYAEMLTLARHGASVLNPRAVRHARDRGVEIHARSTFRPEAGGTVVRDVPRPADPRVVGVACHPTLVPVTVASDDAAERAALGDAVREQAATEDIFLDRSSDRGGTRELFIAADEVPDPAAFGRTLHARFEGRVRVGDARASVSAVGLGLGGAAARWRRASRRQARRAGIRVHGDYSAEHALTCVVDPAQVEPAVELLHERLALAESR